VDSASADPTTLLTVGDVMTRLRFKKPDQVYALIRSGALPASNVSPGTGRPLWRIAEADLTAFLEGRRAVPVVRTSAAPRRRRRAERVTRYF
jgi:hypothetical protein